MREELAALIHDIWWIRWLSSHVELGRYIQAGNFVFPPETIDYWYQQMDTRYANLSEEEKDDARRVADEMLVLLIGYPREELISAVETEGERLHGSQGTWARARTIKKNPEIKWKGNR